jgi:metal-sulfur cluster biosynthetic enzyme
MNVITNNNLRCTVALAVLQQVIDPEIGLDIVDLGLIYQIDFDEQGNKIFCTMTLTTQFCPMGASIVSAVNEILVSAFPDNHIKIELTFNPPWQPDRISEQGRHFLNAV